MSLFDENLHQRDRSGRFTEMTGTEQLDLLAPPAEIDFARTPTIDDLDTAATSYLETALIIASDRWRNEYSTFDASGEFISDEDVPDKVIDDFAPAATQKLRAELGDFIEHNLDHIAAAIDAGYDYDQLGSDFYLDRNGEGAGFRDRDLPEGLGEQLAESASAYGYVDTFIGDDGQVYLEGGSIPTR